MMFLMLFFSTLLWGSSVNLKFLTLNLWDGGSAIGQYNDQRLEKICERFKGGKWDMILLQELWPVRSRAKAMRDCGYPHVASIDREYDEITGHYSWLTSLLMGDKVDTGLRLLSRFPLGEIKRHTYSVSGERDSAFEDGEYLARKSLMLVEVFHPQAGTLLVGNTHLVSTHDGNRYNDQRRLQVEEMAKFVRDNTTDDHVAVILGGDFNFGPIVTGGEPYNNSDYSWDSLIPQLFPGFTHPTRFAQCTYCPSKNDFATNLESAPSDEWVDHFLVTDNFVLKDAAVVFKEKVDIENEGEQIRVHYSDHFGVEVEFELPLP